MPSFPRPELEEMVQRWLDINRRCEETLDWSPMADFYTEDATYGWNVGPNDEFMTVGREEIREIALGLEMAGLGGWTYPYQRVLIDDAQGEIIGFWKQIADATQPDGSHYEIAGLGGSWFRYAGNYQWSWQRDFFDVGNATATFIAMIQADVLSDGMRQRLERAASGTRQPGHFPLGGAPVGLWEGVGPPPQWSKK
ncbi:MAG: nuclear transport factor 2 family protein [Acidimicrobiales bacterium]